MRANLNSITNDTNKVYESLVGYKQHPLPKKKKKKKKNLSLGWCHEPWNQIEQYRMMEKSNGFLKQIVGWWNGEYSCEPGTTWSFPALRIFSVFLIAYMTYIMNTLFVVVNLSAFPKCKIIWFCLYFFFLSCSRNRFICLLMTLTCQL